jgi:hypothetical protein
VAMLKACNKGYPFHPTGIKGSKCRKGAANYCETATCRAGKTEWRPINFFNVTQNQYAVYCVDGVAGRFGIEFLNLTVDFKFLVLTYFLSSN